MQVYDVVFIGSGLSSSATLYHILSHLQQQGHTGTPKKIAVIEKNNEFFKGIPYGNRSSVHSLTINPVKDFFQDSEKPVFFNWLNNLKANNWANYTDEEKSILNKWAGKNDEKLNDTNLDGVYIPRFLYGKYLAEKLETIIAECAATNIAKVDLISGEAVDVTQHADKNYSIAIKTDGENLSVDTPFLIVGTGSLDTGKISTGVSSSHLCIDDIYYPTLGTNTQKLTNALAALPADKRDVLIIGSNASASEVVYILDKIYQQQADGFNKLSILSTSGLPDRLYVNLDYDHLLNHLKALDQAGSYTADDLMLAIEKDVKYIADKHTLSVGKIHYSLSDRVVKMQQKLPADEALRFFNTHGWSFTRITRRTSEDYYITEEELVANGKLEFIKGRFVKLTDEQTNPDGLNFIYKAKGSHTEEQYPKAFPIVINCMGAEHISGTSSPLYKNLLKKGICKINSNNMGLHVDETFLANHNLYIIGPLMAGIYNAKFKFWHLENAKRLNGLAAILADTVIGKMA